MRPRNKPLSEKLLPGERWEEGVLRGIREELAGVLPPEPQVLGNGRRGFKACAGAAGRAVPSEASEAEGGFACQAGAGLQEGRAPGYLCFLEGQEGCWRGPVPSAQAGRAGLACRHAAGVRQQSSHTGLIAAMDGPLPHPMAPNPPTHSALPRHSQVEVEEGSYEMLVEEKDSQSYPGLRSKVRCAEQGRLGWAGWLALCLCLPRFAAVYCAATRAARQGKTRACVLAWCASILCILLGAAGTSLAYTVACSATHPSRRPSSRPRPSPPALPYICHRVRARVAGLPEGDFTTQEERADGTLQHVWVWE